jgi:hypothetical protein
VVPLSPQVSSARLFLPNGEIHSHNGTAYKLPSLLSVALTHCIGLYLSSAADLLQEILNWPGMTAAKIRGQTCSPCGPGVRCDARPELEGGRPNGIENFVSAGTAS